MSRHDEIWRLNQLSAQELTGKEPQRLVVLPEAEGLPRHLARSIADTVRSKPDAVMILPCTPAAQYPALVELVNRKRINLRKARFVFMNEYADANGRALPDFHPVSLRGAVGAWWQRIEPDLRPPEENVLFPDQVNVDELPAIIKQAGGVETCFASLGIHGQIGFNEPGEGVRDSTCRLVRLSDSTITMNAIRAQVGGDLENFPRQGFTIGMRECLSARHLRIYCQSDIPGSDWARTVLRVAVLGQPGDDYPVTWIREHGDWQVITDAPTAEQPRQVM